MWSGGPANPGCAVFRLWRAGGSGNLFLTGVHGILGILGLGLKGAAGDLIGGTVGAAPRVRRRGSADWERTGVTTHRKSKR